MSYSGPNMTLSPAEVKFTQDSVAMCFQNGEELNKTCEEIAKQNLSPTTITNIKVLNLNGEYFSVDNRRLYVFRVLNILGILDHISVKKVNRSDRELTTDNNGCHLYLRNRKQHNRWINAETFKHCTCREGQNRRLPAWWNSALKCHVSRAITQVRRPITCTPSSSRSSSAPDRRTSVKASVRSSFSNTVFNETNDAERRLESGRRGNYRPESNQDPDLSLFANLTISTRRSNVESSYPFSSNSTYSKHNAAHSNSILSQTSFPATANASRKDSLNSFRSNTSKTAKSFVRIEKSNSFVDQIPNTKIIAPRASQYRNYQPTSRQNMLRSVNSMLDSEESDCFYGFLKKYLCCCFD